MPKSEQELAIDTQCLRLALIGNLSRSVGTSISAIVVSWVLTTWVPFSRIAPWFAIVMAINLIRIGSWVWVTRRNPTDEQVRSMLPFYVITMEAAAIVWGFLIGWVGWPSDPLEILIIMVTIAGMMAGGAHSVSMTPRTMYASMFFSFFPGFVHMATSENPLVRPLAALLIGHVLGIFGAVRFSNREARAAIALRFENFDLVRDLRVEKERELEARRAAEKANQDKSRFVAAASHDARQPLHAMGLLVDTLKTQPLEAKSARLVQSIDVAHASLVSLHEGLLELSVAEVGALVPRLVDAPLSALLDTLTTECTARARLRGLELDVRAQRLHLRTDPAMLLRVLRNLVSNAITYTQKGRILVTARRRGQTCLVQIWDTGIGIAPEHLPKIFDELYQVGNTARERSQGLGLGLAIVKRLATAMNTEVKVRSVVGRGSVFSIAIPLAAEIVRHETRSAAGAIALVVDDDGLARNALATMLEQWGFEVVMASDAEEAREYVSALDRLDVVVSDLWLPGASGLELLSGLVTTKPGVKRVLMSGDTTADSEAKIRASGLTFVRKPVRAPRLAEALLLTRLPEAPSVSSPSP